MAFLSIHAGNFRNCCNGKRTFPPSRPSLIAPAKSRLGILRLMSPTAGASPGRAGILKRCERSARLNWQAMAAQVPLLSAPPAGGQIHRLSIREKRKTHLTNRRVDGVIDRTRPVVIIDDSLSSGTSLHKAIVALEEEGLKWRGLLPLSISLIVVPRNGRTRPATAPLLFSTSGVTSE